MNWLGMVINKIKGLDRANEHQRQVLISQALSISEICDEHAPNATPLEVDFVTEDGDPDIEVVWFSRRPERGLWVAVDAAGQVSLGLIDGERSTTIDNPNYSVLKTHVRSFWDRWSQ